MEPQNDPQARANTLMEKLKMLGGAVVLVCMAPFLFGLAKAYLSDRKRQVEGSPPDAKFCSEYLSYYETFCKAYPSHCAEGPRKKARCDQGWDKQ